MLQSEVVGKGSEMACFGVDVWRYGDEAAKRTKRDGKCWKEWELMWLESSGIV